MTLEYVRIYCITNVPKCCKIHDLDCFTYSANVWLSEWKTVNQWKRWYIVGHKNTWYDNQFCLVIWEEKLDERKYLSIKDAVIKTVNTTVWCTSRNHAVDRKTKDKERKENTNAFSIEYLVINSFLFLF